MEILIPGASALSGLRLPPLCRSLRLDTPMSWLWILFFLHIGRAFGFSFTNIGPVTIGSVVTVSWTLDDTDERVQIYSLALGNRNWDYQIGIGDFAPEAGYYTFNWTDSLPSTQISSWYILQPGCVPQYFVLPLAQADVGRWQGRLFVVCGGDIRKTVES